MKFVDLKLKKKQKLFELNKIKAFRNKYIKTINQ
jgi:hypothetical protein